jgi:hypothetical protein
MRNACCELYKLFICALKSLVLIRLSKQCKMFLKMNHRNCYCVQNRTKREKINIFNGHFWVFFFFIYLRINPSKNLSTKTRLLKSNNKSFRTVKNFKS